MTFRVIYVLFCTRRYHFAKQNALLFAKIKESLLCCRWVFCMLRLCWVITAFSKRAPHTVSFSILSL